MSIQYIHPAIIKGSRSRRVIFWLKSSRGTNKEEIITVPAEWSDEEIKDELEDWCSQFGAWHVSENYLTYGWKNEFGDENVDAKG